jgi:hypothetical protein
VLRYLATRPQDGKRVEGTPLSVGLVSAFPIKSSAKQCVKTSVVLPTICGIFAISVKN